jgi:hypothetical protein
VTKWKVRSLKNFIVKVKTANGTIHYGTHSGTVNDYTGNYPILDFSGLDWNTLITDNYQEIKMLLDYNKKVHIELLMDSKTFEELDLTKLVYFKQLGAYFYINKIKHNNINRKTVGEFMFVNL